MRVIGVAGLGAMGLPMAAALKEAGWDPVGYDTDSARRYRASELGIRTVDTKLEFSETVDDLLVVVRTGEQVADVLIGEGSPHSMSKGFVAAVISTIGPGAIRSIAGVASDRGGRLVDAPVTGGVEAVVERRLTVAVAGDDRDVARVVPAIQTFAREVVHVGSGLGMAQAAKLVNQTLMVCMMMGALEGIAVADAYGLTDDRLVPILESGSANCWAVQRWADLRRFREDSEGRFETFSKDLDLVLRAGDEKNIDLTVLKAIHGRLESDPPAGT